MAKDTREKSVQFISKLVQLTQDGKLKWTAESPREDETVTPLKTTLEGRTLRISKYWKIVPNPDYERWASHEPFSITIYDRDREPPKTVTRSGTVLELTDDYDRVVYRLENKTGLSDLYESAAFSGSKIDDLMNVVLGKE